MERTVRNAIAGDGESYVEIKRLLPFVDGGDSSTSGGFLLGTNMETYESYIGMGFCMSALHDEKVVGFGVIFPDEVIKQSELWNKKDEANWIVDVFELEKSKVAYIEQLAFLKGNSRLVLVLAYNMIRKAFDNDVDYVLTTTVKEPIENLAAIPLIKSVGGVLGGSINETYPEIGDIKSSIYLISKKNFCKSVSELSIYAWLKQNEI